MGNEFVCKYKSLELNNLLNRYKEVIMGTPVVTYQNITPVQAPSSSDDFIVLAAPRRDYYLETGTFNFMSPIQETCQFVSSQTVF